jgi:hypothetical protein
MQPFFYVRRFVSFAHGALPVSTGTAILR